MPNIIYSLYTYGNAYSLERIKGYNYQMTGYNNMNTFVDIMDVLEQYLPLLHPTYAFSFSLYSNSSTSPFQQFMAYYSTVYRYLFYSEFNVHTLLLQYE